MDVIDLVMKWAVAPVMAILFTVYNRQQAHATDIAILKSQVEANKLSSDREMKEFRETVRAIFMKLDSIEEYLRDRK